MLKREPNVVRWDTSICKIYRYTQEEENRKAGPTERNVFRAHKIMRLCFQRTKRIYKSILYELSISIRFLGSYPDIYIYLYTLMNLISETTALIFQKYNAAHQILKIQNYIFWNEIYLSLSCIFLSPRREKNIYSLYVSLLYREKNLTILCMEVLTRERSERIHQNHENPPQRNSTPNMPVFIRISIF